MQNQFPMTRMRRLRSHPKLRDMIRETILTPNDLVHPLFIHHGNDVKNPISAMPGHYQLSIDQLPNEIKALKTLSIPAVILFGLPQEKDPLGEDSYSHNGIIQSAIKKIKDLNPDLLIITDACFCEYTDHGHCGVLHNSSKGMDVDNDATLELLAQQAISHAQAGADIIAPSGMMDGMVSAIRQGLDGEGFHNTPILSYAAKYSSSLYGPFRHAVDSAPQMGDRKSYQMDAANSNEALREIALDVQEGADMLMVKPATYYLDILRRTKDAYPGIPLGAYHVSGEYAMIKAAAEKGWIDEEAVMLEALTSIKRAGADFIINYFCKEVSKKLLG